MKRHGQLLSLLFIDLDKFKPVNDVYGHKAGDAVLREIAKRLISTIREEDFLARIGGDEFIILIQPLIKEIYVHDMAKRILKVCN